MSELTAKKNIKAADTVKRITATAVMAALTTLMTAYIFHIPVGVNGGYVHLGDTMIYLAAAFLPLPYACAAGAIGGGLADLLTAPVWAPATIIIKMLICLPFSSKGIKLVTKRNVVALFLAFAISATGYYIAEGIIYGNWIGGCLMASLFLILIYSISRCKKEEKQLEFKANVQERIITQGEMIKIIPEISGINTRNDDYIFEVEYEIESKFYGTKNKIRQKIRWNQKIDNLLLTEEMKKCDHVVFRLISVSWEDLTGIYKIKKYLQQEIRILVMPHSYELGTMNDRLKKMNSCEQGFEYDGVRKYREGDRLSRIHWNLYATSRDLWVRKNEDEAQESVKIAISLKDINKDRISDYFAVVYSVLLFYMNAGVNQEIYYGNHMFLLKHIEQYEELFTDIFECGISEISMEIPNIQAITLDDNIKNIQKYLYEMEL